MFHTSKIKKIKQVLNTRVLILLFLVPIFSFNLHKEYYSITQIDYNTKEKALQISMGVFTDDMELALQKYYEKTLELGTKYEDKEADTFLKNYLKTKFSIAINGKEVTYTYIGKEIEQNRLKIYMEVENIPFIKQISIRNSILTEVFFEQQNIIKTNINKQNKRLILSLSNDKAMLKY